MAMPSATRPVLPMPGASRGGDGALVLPSDPRGVHTCASSLQAARRSQRCTAQAGVPNRLTSHVAHAAHACTKRGAAGRG